MQTADVGAVHAVGRVRMGGARDRGTVAIIYKAANPLQSSGTDTV